MARYDHLPNWKAAQNRRAMLDGRRRVGTPRPRVALAAMPTVDVSVTVRPRGHWVPTLRNWLRCCTPQLQYSTAQLNKNSMNYRLSNSFFVAAICFVVGSTATFASTCPANVGATATPTSDFVVNANGTVSHTPTGLG